VKPRKDRELTRKQWFLTAEESAFTKGKWGNTTHERFVGALLEGAGV
jgi:hypothetical protein